MLGCVSAKVSIAIRVLGVTIGARKIWQKPGLDALPGGTGTTARRHLRTGPDLMLVL